MSYQERNLAYDFALFEEKARKSEKKRKAEILSLPEQRKQKKAKANPFFAFFTGVTCVLSVVGVATMVYGQVQLTELTDNIIRQQQFLEEQESVNTQIQMAINSKLSLEKIEETAKNQLNMAPPNKGQIEYINLMQDDYAAVKTGTENKFLEDIKNMFFGLWA